VFFLLIVCSFEVFVPSNIPFLNFSPSHFSSFYFTSLFSFLHYVITPGLRPSTVFCFYFLSFTFLFYFVRASQHISFPGFLSSALIFLYSSSTVCRCLFIFCAFIQTSLSSYSPSLLPLQWRTRGGGCRAAAPTPKPPKPKFKRNFVNIVMSDVCDLPFSCNHPLKSADD
jgi:hypothetical protein